MNKYVRNFIVISCCFFVHTIQASDELHVDYTYGKDEKLGAILQKFSETTGIHIRSEYKAQDDLKVGIMAMMESNAVPDAIILPSDHLGLHELLKYSEVNKAIFKASIPERVWNNSISDGKHYGAPLIQGNFLLLYYNKSLVKNPARDWDEMAIQKAEFDAKKIATIAWSYTEPFWILPFLGAYGGWPMNKGKVELDTPAMVAALDFYKKLGTQNIPYLPCAYLCTVELFKAEKVAYTIGGEWEGRNFFNSLGDKLGASAIPEAEGRKIISPFSTQVIAFPNNSLNGKKRAQLIKLVNYLQSSAVQQQLWEQMGAIPVEAKAFASAKKNAQGYLKETLALMDDTKPLPSDKAMTYIWDAFGKGKQRFLAGSLDAKNTASFMQQLAERHLRNAQEKIPEK